MSEASERRTAERIACRVPLGGLGLLTDAMITIVDLSATGLRIRVSLEDLGLEPETNLLQIWDRSREVLRGAPRVSLRPEVLGSLVSRRMRPVRLIPCGQTETYVEVGCEFDEPLSEEEIAFLDLAGATLAASALFGESENDVGRRTA